MRICRRAGAPALRPEIHRPRGVREHPVRLREAAHRQLRPGHGLPGRRREPLADTPAGRDEVRAEACRRRRFRVLVPDGEQPGGGPEQAVLQDLRGGRAVHALLQELRRQRDLRRHRRREEAVRPLRGPLEEDRLPEGLPSHAQGHLGVLHVPPAGGQLPSARRIRARRLPQRQPLRGLHAPRLRLQQDGPVRGLRPGMHEQALRDGVLLRKGPRGHGPRHRPLRPAGPDIGRQPHPHGRRPGRRPLRSALCDGQKPQGRLRHAGEPRGQGPAAHGAEDGLPPDIPPRWQRERLRGEQAEGDGLGDRQDGRRAVAGRRRGAGQDPVRVHRPAAPRRVFGPFRDLPGHRAGRHVQAGRHGRAAERAELPRLPGVRVLVLHPPVQVPVLHVRGQAPVPPEQGWRPLDHDDQEGQEGRFQDPGGAHGGGGRPAVQQGLQPARRRLQVLFRRPAPGLHGHREDRLGAGPRVHDQPGCEVQGEAEGAVRRGGRGRVGRHGLLGVRHLQDAHLPRRAPAQLRVLRPVPGIVRRLVPQAPERRGLAPQAVPGDTLRGSDTSDPRVGSRRRAGRDAALDTVGHGRIFRGRDIPGAGAAARATPYKRPLRWPVR